MRASATVLATLALSAAGGVAIAQVSGSQPADPQNRPNPVITAVDAAQAASFSVLRTAGAPAELTPDAQRLVETGLGPDLGASAALARQAGTMPDGQPLYVVPARGWMCVVTGDGAGGCNRTAEVVAGYGVMLQGEGDQFALAGIVPDGVSTVSVTGQDGSVDVGVGSNAWSASVGFEPETVRWSAADGPHEVRVWAPPAGVGEPPPGG